MTNTLLAIGSFLIVLTITCLILFIQNQKKLKKFLSGSNAQSLEGKILDIVAINNNLIEENKKIKEDINLLQKRIQKTIRRVETVRFNPFPDQGSNQSFATALINDDGDGVVLSSLYSRERVSIFAKPIHGRKSDYELTNEEREVLTKSS